MVIVKRCNLKLFHNALLVQLQEFYSMHSGAHAINQLSSCLELGGQLAPESVFHYLSPRFSHFLYLFRPIQVLVINNDKCMYPAWHDALIPYLHTELLQLVHLTAHHTLLVLATMDFTLDIQVHMLSTN